MGGLGSGQPLTFGCYRCRVADRGLGAGKAFAWRPTGRIRRKPARGAPLRVSPARQAEYECTDCGHVGWSRHVDVVRRALRLTGGVG